MPIFESSQGYFSHKQQLGIIKCNPILFGRSKASAEATYWIFIISDKP